MTCCKVGCKNCGSQFMVTEKIAFRIIPKKMRGGGLKEISRNLKKKNQLQQQKAFFG